MFRVIYFVSNTERVAGFYQRALGAKRMKPPAAQDYPSEEWIQVKTAGVEIGFHRVPFLKARKRKPDCAFKLVFKVPDVTRKRKALRKMGVSMTKIWRLERGSICDGWDPEGHRFQIADR
jgi:predicted enzyme related to lactoylglutathione lyase